MKIEYNARQRYSIVFRFLEQLPNIEKNHDFNDLTENLSFRISSYRDDFVYNVDIKIFDLLSD